MRAEVKVITQKDPLRIRENAGTSFNVIGSLPKGSIVIVNGTSPVAGTNWFKLEGRSGWISGQYVQVVRYLDQTVETKPSPQPQVKEEPTINTPSDTTIPSKGFDVKMLEMLYNTPIKSKNEINASTRLFGCPFQFLKQTDFRINSEVSLGRKYMENIVAESPIVYFLPGKPNYLPDLSDSEKDSLTLFFMDRVRNNNEGDNRSILDSILQEKEVRYFDFISDYSEYMKYVNLLCRICSIYIGLSDRNVPGTNTPYKYFDWGNYRYTTSLKSESKNKGVFNIDEIKEDLQETLFGEHRYVQFYVDPSTSFSESSNNNTQQSKMEGLFDTAEGLIKEMSFLTNTAAIKEFDDIQLQATQSIDEIKDKLSGSKENFFSRLLGMVNPVLKGSNIIFPELWGDSAYNKSYNVTINLATPYGDKESWFLNIGVPLMHILALTLPRQSTPNSYSSPFLVKVFAKGWFSCELGIIDSISIDKGGNGDSWTVDGLPSEVKVSLSVKDLYNNLMITSSSKPGLFYQNQGLIDFLAVTCGVNIAKPNFLLRVETLFSIFLGKITDIPSNFYRDFTESVKNKIEGLWKL